MGLCSRYGGARLSVLVALVGLILATSAGVAHAQAIGSGSCQTSDGSTACTGDPGLVSVGANSCDGVGSPCSSDPSITSVGSGSCADGTQAGDCTDDPNLTLVDDSSCTGGPFAACADSSSLVSVGTNSCDSFLGSCSIATTVGNGSCDATGGEQVACSGSVGEIGPIGSGSCNGPSACGAGLTSVGNDSCNNTNRDGCQGDVGSVDDSSCDDGAACDDVGDIGYAACNGAHSCTGLPSNASPPSVGFYSCNGAQACNGISEDVGVCQDNTVTVVLCDPGASPVLESGSAPPDWDGAEVTVDWNWSPGQDGADLSAASSSNCPASSTSSGQGTVTLTATCADENGNTGTASYTVNVDLTGPTDAPVVSGTPGTDGWYTSPVSVAWNWTDGLSGLDASACSQTSTSGSQEGQAVVLTSPCEDNAGYTATDQQSFKIDTTAPTIAFTGNRRTYALLQMVDITCAAVDNAGGSGVASSSCQTPVADAAAWTFGPGTTTLTASATDNAGNVGSGSTEFTVNVTTGALCTLTAVLVDGSAKYKALHFLQRSPVNAGVRAACADLKQITRTSTPQQAAAAIAAYDVEVQVLATPGWLSSPQATTLTALAAAL